MVARVKTYVVLDTNVWVYTTRLLSTALGASLLYSASRAGHSIYIPHVIELEVRKHIAKLVREAVSQIDTGYRTVEVVMGVRDDYQVPREDEVLARLDQRLSELGSIVVKGDFTFEDAKKALARVIDSTPPNAERDQQFKDSAIWEALLRLGSLSHVHFITEDKAFFKDREPSKGLADNLAEEAAHLSGSLTLYASLPAYLELASQALPPLDLQTMADAIASAIAPQLNQYAEEKGYVRGPLRGHSIAPFLTERATVLSLEFHLTFEILRLPSPQYGDSVDITQEVKGTCGFDISSNTPEDVVIQDISLFDAQGQRLSAFGQAFIHGVGNIFLGRKVVPHRLRKPIS